MTDDMKFPVHIVGTDTTTNKIPTTDGRAYQLITSNLWHLVISQTSLCLYSSESLKTMQMIQNNITVHTENILHFTYSYQQNIKYIPIRVFQSSYHLFKFCMAI